MIRSVLRWLDSPWAFELLPGLNKLGRNPTNDFRISDPSISAFHAEIAVERDIIRVRDLGSTNGTFIDEVRIEEGLLKPENVLRLGNVRLALDEVPVTPVCQVPASNTAASAPSPAEPAGAQQQVEFALRCVYHASERAAYRCENCGGGFCFTCITVIGQSKFGATTICPMCKGQCYALPTSKSEKNAPGFLGRLTQTLRLPFSR